jgi:DNA mismatch repair protein MutL
VELAFYRNATSKLTSASDLETIGSLGFRGEALPSIASVAEVEMFSLSVGETAGTQVTIREGRVVQRASRGRPPGTAVTVRNLFRAVPARLKFLKSPATENGHIANLVDQYALAHPEVRFLLYMEGRPCAPPGPGSPGMVWRRSMASRWLKPCWTWITGKVRPPGPG